MTQEEAIKTPEQFAEEATRRRSYLASAIAVSSMSPGLSATYIALANGVGQEDRPMTLGDWVLTACVVAIPVALVAFLYFS